MPIEWSGLGPGLLLALDRGSGEPLRSQLEGQLRSAIREGRLGVGERLPSSRELARDLGLSRGLVQECYGQLQAEGYLSSLVGSATRVAAGAAAEPVETPVPVREPAGERLRVDFLHGVPDLASFPVGDWMWAMREACRTAPVVSFDYGDPRGSRVLREVLAAYLRRVRAAAADPERMVICTGYAQGLGLVLRAVAAAGVRRVAFEDPGAGGSTSAVARWASLDAVAVPVDEGGIDVGLLAASGARAVIVTPAHQWPTGVVLAPARRHELVAWAAGCDGWIVEDDYDAEFRYDREPVGALQGLAVDRVAAVGTVSKSLAPSMRLGWVLCPPVLAGSVAGEKRLSDRGSPGLDQLAFAALVESGRYDRHLRRMRGVYGARREVLVDALARHAPGVVLSGLAAGFHAVVELPSGVDEAAVVAAARARSVGVYGMGAMRSRPGPPRLVLGFGNVNERAIESGVAAVADLLRG